MSVNEEILRREPCPKCREQGGDTSGDNLIVYADGHKHCFACQYHEDGGGKARIDKTKKPKKLLNSAGEYKGLRTRKITKETCEKFQYQVSTYKGKTIHIAPYFTNTGDLVAQHVRYVSDKGFAWLGDFDKVELFGKHLWRAGGKRVVVTEGEIDAMSVSQLQGNRWPVVSVPNGAQNAYKFIKKNLEWLESFEEVVLCFDMDEAGRDAVKKIAPLFSPMKAKVAHLPEKDANEMLKKNKGDQLIACLWEARTFRPDGIVNGSELWELVLKDPPAGYETKFPKLNEMFNGLRKGELYLCTAGSGIGKSTFVHELAYDLMQRHHLNIGVLALEESVKHALERYLSIYLNKPIYMNREGISEAELKEAFKETAQTGRLWFLDHFGSTEVGNLLSRIRYMLVGLNIDFLVLDHISIVVSGLDEKSENERKLIDIFMTKLRSLIQETGAGVLAVVHLKRPGQGKSWNEGRQVSLTDLRGSGSLEQLSDGVIALERDQQDEQEGNVSTVRVLKNRAIGTCGLADRLEYTPETGRLTLVDDSPFKDEVDMLKAKIGEEDF